MHFRTCIYYCDHLSTKVRPNGSGAAPQRSQSRPPLRHTKAQCASRLAQPHSASNVRSSSNGRVTHSKRATRLPIGTRQGAQMTRIRITN